MTIKAIIFDFGRVVGFFDHRLTANRLAPFTDLSPDSLHALLFASEFEDAYESGRITTEAFIGQAIEQGRLRCTRARMACAWADIFAPNWSVMEMVPRLRGRYRLLLGSNTNELHTMQFSRQFAETFAHFDHLVYSFEIGIRKPAAGFFEHCLRLAGSTPEESVFIDDMPANVEGAKKCGLHGIHYVRTEQLCSELHTLGVEV